MATTETQGQPQQEDPAAAAGTPETAGYGTVSEARRELRRLAERSAELVGAISDPERPVSRSTWTCGELAAHLVIALQGYAASVNGDSAAWRELIPPGDDPRFDRRLGAFNTRSFQVVTERDPGALAAQLVPAVEAFLAASEGHDPAERIPTPWYGRNATLTIERATCLLIGEQVMHGRDLARTLGTSWTIEPVHAKLILNAAMSMLPMMADPERAPKFDVACDVQVRGGQRFVIRARNGAVSIEPSDGQPVTFRMSVDPVGFALVGYGRINQWSAIARGQLMPWGRRPWEALRLKSLFVNP